MGIFPGDDSYDPSDPVAGDPIEEPFNPIDEFNERQWERNRPDPPPAAEPEARDEGEELPDLMSGPLNMWGKYLQYQRKNITRLLRQYRSEFPKFLRGWAQIQRLDLREASKDAFEGGLTNLWQRGLGESPGFIAGLANDVKEAQAKGLTDINAQKQKMKSDAIMMAMNVIGRPNFPGLVGGYSGYQGLMNQNAQNEWLMNFLRDKYKDDLEHPEKKAPEGVDVEYK